MLVTPALGGRGRRVRNLASARCVLPAPAEPALPWRRLLCRCGPCKMILPTLLQWSEELADKVGEACPSLLLLGWPPLCTQNSNLNSVWPLRSSSSSD